MTIYTYKYTRVVCVVFASGCADAVSPCRPKRVLGEYFEKFVYTNRFVINEMNHTRSSHLVKRI